LKGRSIARGYQLVVDIFMGIGRYIPMENCAWEMWLWILVSCMCRNNGWLYWLIIVRELIVLGAHGLCVLGEAGRRCDEPDEYHYGDVGWQWGLHSRWWRPDSQWQGLIHDATTLKTDSMTNERKKIDTEPENRDWSFQEKRNHDEDEDSMIVLIDNDSPKGLQVIYIYIWASWLN
jgi:hypothetical protein